MLSRGYERTDVLSRIILLDEKSVIEALSKVQPGLHKYLHIRNLIYNVDVSKSTEFKQAFNGFYRMRQRPKLKTMEKLLIKKNPEELNLNSV
jgi:hypothetical protein